MVRDAQRLDSARLDLNGRGSIGRRAIAQLAVAIVAHGPQRTIGLAEETMVDARGDLGHARGFHLNGCVPIRRRTVPKLPRIVSPHGP